jgi:2-amino-4-hydroxy-6-hydroxymethyldihydropteridine diphosphokinase
VLIGLGTNLPFGPVSGAPLLAAALEELAEQGLQILAASRPWVSPSWPPGRGAPDYVNAVARLATAQSAPSPLTPEALLAVLQRVEAAFGRQRSTANAPRTLDLDLLAFGRVVSNDPSLILPHPRLQDRDFVLGPLLEVAPGWICPRSGVSARAMWEALPACPAWPAPAQPSLV